MSNYSTDASHHLAWKQRLSKEVFLEDRMRLTEDAFNFIKNEYREIPE